jgi:hypothetical protein
MSLARPWENAYKRLLVELESRWGKTPVPGTIAAVLSPWDRAAFDEYPGFVGERERDQFYVSLKADLLSLSVFRPLDAQVVIRPEGFVDRFLKAVRLDWEYQTGNPIFDHKFYFEQIKTEAEKRLVCDPGFQKLVVKLEPFVSVAVTDKGVHWSVMVDAELRLTVGFVDERLGFLSQLARQVSEVMSGGNC